MMLPRWVIREHFVSGAYLRIYFSDCHLYIALGGPVVTFRVYEL